MFREQSYHVPEIGDGNADGDVDLILSHDGERTLVQDHDGLLFGYCRRSNVSFQTVRVTGFRYSAIGLEFGRKETTYACLRRCEKNEPVGGLSEPTTECDTWQMI